MSEQDTIMWGFEPKPQPESMRSKEQALKAELEEGLKQERR